MVDQPCMCNDPREAVAEDTDQRRDQKNVGHANEDKLFESKHILTARMAR